jgi:hypothetical protein
MSATVASIIGIILIPLLLWLAIDFYQYVTGKRFICLLGFHAPARYTGRIRVHKIDREARQIEYANILACPKCGKDLKLDESH